MGRRVRRSVPHTHFACLLLTSRAPVGAGREQLSRTLALGTRQKKRRNPTRLTGNGKEQTENGGKREPARTDSIR